MIRQFALAMLFAMSAVTANAAISETVNPSWHKARLLDIITALTASNMCPDSNVAQEDKLFLSNRGRDLVKSLGHSDQQVYEIYTLPVLSDANANLLDFCARKLPLFREALDFWR